MYHVQFTILFFFFFNDTATTEIYTLSLHDALPICALPALELVDFRFGGTPTAADAVADGVFANAIVLGQPLTPVAAIDLALEGVVYEQNGQVAATNTAAEVLGNPLNSLAWIANHLAGRGL